MSPHDPTGLETELNFMCTLVTRLVLISIRPSVLVDSWVIFRPAARSS